MRNSTASVKKAFVAGWPIEHSLSPVLHGHWLKRYGISGSYEAVAVDPSQFGAFLSKLPRSGFCGGNVTIPHKEAALAACHEVTGEALAIGAVNTIWLENGTLFGTNTDAYGFAANLDDHAPHWKRGPNALVLGAGGAARAVVNALVSAGVSDIAIANRTAEKAVRLATEFGKACRALDWRDIPQEIASADLVVNTTSLGMTGQPPLDVDLGQCRSGTIVTDIVYSPLETPLLAQARRLGLTAIDGLGMLLHQAAPGFEIWFGSKPAVDDELRGAVLAALETRRANS